LALTFLYIIINYFIFTPVLVLTLISTSSEIIFKSELKFSGKVTSLEVLLLLTTSFKPNKPLVKRVEATNR
jgi:hypothetical protein